VICYPALGRVMLVCEMEDKIGPVRGKGREG
jgi:hypothetical protein